MEKKRYAHGVMVYRCEKCGEVFTMKLEMGIEERKDGIPVEQCKPSPFLIRCPYCGGTAKDAFCRVFAFPKLRPIRYGERFFANEENRNCGISTRYGMKWKEETKMKKHSPQEIVDFFDCYVAQDKDGTWCAYSNEPVTTDDDKWGMEEEGAYIEITDYVETPEGHDWKKLYEPSKPDKAPHQSQVYTHGEYMIVRSPSRDTDDLSMLESGVMIWVRAGWKPIGGVTFDKKGYPCQAMVRGL